jgi:proteic killer suppression protein
VVIKSFRHKGLQRFFASGSKAGIIPDHAPRLRILLTDLNAVTHVEDLDTPGYRLHQLTEDQAGRWSLTVRANWRITFDFVDGDAYIVNYEDYH